MLVTVPKSERNKVKKILSTGVPGLCFARNKQSKSLPYDNIDLEYQQEWAFQGLSKEQITIPIKRQIYRRLFYEYT